jgi:predicted RNA-binding protein
MCESKVVKKTEKGEEVVMEEAMRIEVDGDKLTVFGILGEKIEINGKVILIDMKNHTVVVE